MVRHCSNLSLAPLLVLTCAVCLTNPAEAQHRSELSFAATSAVHCLATRNDNSFNKLVSAHGVLVVRRTVDWHTSKQYEAVNNQHEVWANDLSLASTDASTWVEKVVQFDPSDLRTAEYKKILSQFELLVQNSLDGYKSSVKSGNDLEDAWGIRHLGPSAQGKIASNAYWYIYFTKEHGLWRIWRLEYVTH